MEIISNIALITINETVIAVIVSFLIFLFILNRLMVKPLTTTMAERVDYISNLEQEIVDTKNRAEQLTIELKARESAAREEALLFKTELEEVGSKKADEICNAAREEISDIQKLAKKDVERQISGARKTIEKESVALSLEIMEKVLGRRLAS